MMLGLGDDSDVIDLTSAVQQVAAGNYFDTPTGLVPCSSVTVPAGSAGPYDCDSSGGGPVYTNVAGGAVITPGTVYGPSVPPGYVAPAMNSQQFWSQYGTYVLVGVGVMVLLSMSGGGRRR